MHITTRVRKKRPFVCATAQLKKTIRSAACIRTFGSAPASQRDNRGAEKGLNDQGNAVDLRTAAHAAAALSSGIGSLIKFSLIEGSVISLRRRHTASHLPPPPFPPPTPRRCRCCSFYCWKVAINCLSRGNIPCYPDPEQRQGVTRTLRRGE